MYDANLSPVLLNLMISDRKSDFRILSYDFIIESETIGTELK